MSASLTDNLRTWAAPLLEEHRLELYDVEHVGGVLRVVVTRESGVGLDEIAKFSRGLSALLDERDPIRSQYTFEVSSPGIERRLRTPEHFVAATGSMVKVKLARNIDGDRRLAGTIVDVDQSGVTLQVGEGERRLEFGDIDTARTVFPWPSTDKPARGGAATHSSGKSKAAHNSSTSNPNKKATS